MRKLGLTYTEIRTLIPVPKTTLSGWCRGIELTPEQAAAIRSRTGSPAGIPRDTQWRRRVEIEAIKAAACDEVPQLLEKPLWVAGTALYWAEGSKTTRRLALTNSDPAVLRIFRDGTRSFHDPDADFVLALHLHHGNPEPEARAFWSDALDIPGPPFHKSFVKPPGGAHRNNRHPRGVCRITVRRSADHFVRTMAWIDALAAALT